VFENSTTEFKREYTDNIRRSVVAFANTDGGDIYIGINDDGCTCGVSDPDATILRVSNMIRDAIRPDVTMFTNCSIETIDGLNVVKISVQRGTARPYYLSGKGVRPEGVLVRQGASSVPASEAAILNMIKETSGDSYEDARSLQQKLTFKYASAYFKKKKVAFSDTQRRTLGLIGADGTFSNLGMLLSDQCGHTIKMAVYEGGVKNIFRDRKELSGSLLSQLEEAYSYIDQFNHTRAEFAGLNRIDKRDYPQEAIREALLNAVVHRDYSISSPTLVSIFDDRLEIITIGGLARGITYADIMLGVSLTRNPHLANIFYRLKLIESYGTGLLKINESYAGSSTKPQIDITDNAFKITLPNRNAACNNVAPTETTTQYSSDTSREAAILALLEHQQTITRKDAEAALGLSQPTTSIILREMVEQGVLLREGGGKYVRYRLNIPDCCTSSSYNATTEAAMAEARDIMSGKVKAKTYGNVEDMFADLED
jgi:ATP-dependent DNA helicase RecG